VYGIVNGRSSLALCCEPMQRANKSARSLRREKPWLRRRNGECERECSSFVWQSLLLINIYIYIFFLGYFFFFFRYMIFLGIEMAKG
jgi:hypothetical protein